MTANKKPDPVVFDSCIKRGKEEIKQVEVREFNAGEMRGLRLVEVANAHVDSIIKLGARVTVPPLTEDELSKMNPADFGEIALRIANFLEQKNGSR